MVYKSIPIGWIEISLTDDLLFIKTGVNEYEGEKEYFSTGSIQDGSISSEGRYSYSNRPSRANRIAQKGDIFQARMKNTNKALLIDKSLNSKLFSTGFFQIRPDPKSINNKYIFYYLSSLTFHKVKDKLCTGSTQEALNNKNAKNILIPIPPIQEQQRIVEKIEELFSEIDKGIEYLQTAKEQLMVYQQAVLDVAFEGKLTKTTKKIGWETSTLNAFAKEIRTGPFGTLLHASDYITNGVPVINPKSITNQKTEPDPKVSISKDKADSLEKYRLKENDIILGRRGEMGRTAYITQKENGWICGTGSMIIRLNNEDSSKLYSLYLSSRKVKGFLLSNSTGTTMNNLNQKIAKRIPVPLIPVEEQQRLLSEIESRLSVCDHMEETIEKGLAKAESLKQSILKNAFEGRLVPQDPDDEPAAVLLERVREEKRKREEALA